MSLQDENMRALAHQSSRLAFLMGHFMMPDATWDGIPQGGDEAWLEMLKTDLVAIAGQVQERINQITVSTPQEFG